MSSSSLCMIRTDGMRTYRFLLVMVLAAACCTALATAAVLPVSERDNGRTIGARVGDTILLKLQENPSTGYTWTLSVTPGLTVTRDQHSPSILRRMGAPGTHEWQIRVMQSGEQTISAVYSRAWEAEATGGKVVTLSFRVSDIRNPVSIPASRISRQEILDLLKR
jgi:inhibitor of cysteine peptidase